MLQIRMRSILIYASVCLILGLPDRQPVYSQTIGGQGGQGQGGQGQGGGLQAPGGIAIDAQGVVTAKFLTTRTKWLSKKRMLAVAKKALSAELNQSTSTRKVSLVRLEAECAKYVREKTAVPIDVFYLAGLQRIDYVFVYPDAKDVVIVGPAEGFSSNGEHVVGVTSGRPPIRLDDLIVALRSIQRAGPMGCSIDPVPEKLAALQRFIGSNNGAASASFVVRRFRRMASILGMQDVSVWGVPAESHFAEVMVEADYRMKCIALGLEKPGVRGLRSHLAMLVPNGNNMQRWWFTPLYDAFQKTPAGDAFMFKGQRAQLMSQEEYADAAGNRISAPVTRVTTKQFAKQFTERFPELASKSPVFAQLQNLFDLAILAALLKKERLAEKIDWEMEVFLDPQQTQIARGHAPRQVKSLMNFKRAKQGIFLCLVGGGITLDPMRTVGSIEFQTDLGRDLVKTRASAVNQSRQAKHPWWWD